ncbi:hypothetical protein BVG84_12740 [Serratia marcescens]|nr:hypothetical protein BVG95_11940 [Serratia marcescens]ASM31831.1 hypothetical protein BVG84_12740 [Serratia marcescens]
MIKKEVLIISMESKNIYKIMIFICKKSKTPGVALFDHSKNALKDIKKTTHEFFLRLFLAN